MSALAAVILAFLMLIPFVNIGVGLIAGAMLGGLGGAIVGAGLGFLITVLWSPKVRGY